MSEVRADKGLVRTDKGFLFTSDCPVCDARGQQICRPREGHKRQVYVYGWRRFVCHDGRQIEPGKFVKKWEVV